MCLQKLVAASSAASSAAREQGQQRGKPTYHDARHVDRNCALEQRGTARPKVLPHELAIRHDAAPRSIPAG